MKDSTLYTILCVIVAVFCIFLGYKMIVPKQNQGKEEKTEPQVVENQNSQNNQKGNTQMAKNEEEKTQENKGNNSTQEETISGSSVFYENVKTYEGKQSAYKVRSMLENVRNSNLLTQKKICVEYKGIEHINDIYELKSEFEGGGSYEVVFEYEKDSRRHC